jgi:hypothetical protein
VKRIIIAVVVAVVTAFAVNGSAFAGDNPGKGKKGDCPAAVAQYGVCGLSVDEANSLATTPGSLASTPVEAISPDEALAASTVPGAETEVLSPALVAESTTDAALTTAAASVAASTCWYIAWNHSHGTWPYDQHITLHTTWCGNGSWITSRSSWTSHGETLCDGHDAYAQKILGGAGYSSVTVEGGAYFSCPTTIPWITIHTHVWEQIKYTAWGSSWAVNWS